MQNKWNTCEKFGDIGKQIKSSFESAMNLSRIFTFSEPSSIDLNQSLISDSIGSEATNFCFSDPLKPTGSKEEDVAKALIDSLQSLKIDYSNVDSNITSFQSSTEKESENGNSNKLVTPEDCQDTIANNVHTSVDLDPNTQITNLDTHNHNIYLPPITEKVYDKQPLPLLIKHVHKITWPNQDKVFCVPIMNIFGQSFEAVIVHGTVTSLKVENGGLLQRFVLDDGSESIPVVWKADKEITDLIRNVQDLDEKIKSCQQSGLSVMSVNWEPNSKESREMLSSLSNIMLYIKKQLTKRTKLKLFGSAAVVGKPIRIGKNVILHTNQIQDDSDVDRSLELYFKKNLIRLYEEKYCLS